MFITKAHFAIASWQESLCAYLCSGELLTLAEPQRARFLSSICQSDNAVQVPCPVLNHSVRPCQAIWNSHAHRRKLDRHGPNRHLYHGQ